MKDLQFSIIIQINGSYWDHSMSPYCLATAEICYCTFYFCWFTIPTTPSICLVTLLTWNYNKSTKVGLRAKMRPKAITILMSINTSHSKKSPRKGMIVHAATIWNIQKAIHFEDCSLLKTVPTNGNTQQARNTIGVKSMTINIVNIVIIIIR